MIPAWLDPEVSALMAGPVIYGECDGGPYDGHRQAVPGGCAYLMIGDAGAAWTAEAGPPPGTAARDVPHLYRWHGRVKDDGTRIYEYAAGGA